MGVILFDGRLDLIWASRATLAWSGGMSARIAGRNVLDLVPPRRHRAGPVPMLEVALDDPQAAQPVVLGPDRGAVGAG